MAKKYIQVELIGSGIGRSQRQKDTLRGLGLRRMHQKRVLENTPAVRGMVTKVMDLVRWAETSGPVKTVSRPQSYEILKADPSRA